jgi:hypothetical protein
LEQWQQLTSSTPGLITRRAVAGRDHAATATSSGGGGAQNKPTAVRVVDPLDDFVGMEYDLAGEICAVVDASLQALKKVPRSLLSIIIMSAAILRILISYIIYSNVGTYSGAFWFWLIDSCHSGRCHCFTLWRSAWRLAIVSE